MRLLSSIRRLLIKVPYLRPWLRRGHRALMGAPFLGRLIREAPLAWWKLKMRFSGRGGELPYCDIHKRHWISPGDIAQFYFEGGHDQARDHGTVVDGDWDLSVRPFEDFKIFHALRERFVEGRPWEEIDYIKTLTERCRGNKSLRSYEDWWEYWDVNGEEEIAEKCRKAEALHASMKEKGYVSQKELLGETNPKRAELDEITVRVGRRGDLLFQDGRHRLALAKLLELPEMAVKITARHKKWKDLRDEAVHFASTCPDGKTYQRLCHPDLADVPCAHGDERFEIIRTSLDRTSGTLLDIGANLGYFCHRFERLGFDCVAVERYERNVYFLERLKRASNRKFEIFNGSIFDYRGREDFDVVLALNIFHHFMKTEEDARQLADFLGRIRIGTMFFEPHDPSEKPMQSAHLNLAPDAFAQWVAERANLKTIIPFGQAPDGRRLFKLSF